MGFLTFLPFLLQSKGAGLSEIVREDEPLPRVGTGLHRTP